MKTRTRAQATLITAQLLFGAGIASGDAVGGLLAEEITVSSSVSPCNSSRSSCSA